MMLALVGKASISLLVGLDPSGLWTCGPAAVAAANIGLLSGETPLELSELALEVGLGLLNPGPDPFLRLIWLVIVLEIVCLAACFALSVETKLLTRSLRLPLTSGEANSSKGLSEGPLLGSVAALFIKLGDVRVDVGLDRGETLFVAFGNVEEAPKAAKGSW
jgi:hypothetical protein